MANSTDAELRIGGNIDELKAATDKAVVQVRQMSEQMQGSLASLNSAFQKIHGTFMAFTAVLAGGAAFRGVINASNEWAGDSLKLAKTLGTTTEQASVLKVALNHIGVESDVMVAASQKMSKQIFSNGQAFETMGIKVKDSSGQYRPVVEVMGEANQKLLEIKNPIAQNIAGMQLYGRSWAEIRPILKLTAEVMEQSAQRAKELHLIVGPEGAAQARQYKEQMRDLTLVGKSLEVQFGNALTPVFVKLGSWMSQEAPAAGEVFKNILLTVAAAGQTVWLTLQRLGEGLGALAASANAALRGEFGKAKEIYDEYRAGGEKFVADMKSIWARAYDTPAAKASAGPEMGGKQYDFGKDSGSGDKSRMGQWEAQLAEAKVFFQKTYELREYSKQQEMEYWRSILENVKVSGQERVAITKKVSELELEIMKKARQQKSALEAEAINNREKIADDGLKVEEAMAQREYEMGSINKQQLLALEQQFENRRYEISRQAQQDRIEALKGDPNMDPVALQKLLDEMTEIQRRHNLRILQTETQAAAETKKTWDQALSPIASAFDKTVTGIIQGTQTLKKGLSNIFNSILGEFVSMSVKMLARWATTAATNFAISQGWITKEKALKLGFLDQSASAQVSASSTISSAKTSEAAAVVPAEAAEAAGGAASAVASIPYVGPIMAAAAFASIMAMVMGGLKSASGGYDVPSGVNPMTQLHEQEMVLPAKYANVIRGMSEGGGASSGSGDNIHFHVHTPDVSGVKSWLKSNSSVMVPALRNLHRNFTSMKR